MGARSFFAPRNTGLASDSCATRQGANNRHYEYGSQDGYDQGAYVETRQGRLYTEQGTRQESTDQCADYPQDHIPEDSVAAALHNEAGQPSGDNPNDNPGQDTHT